MQYDVSAQNAIFLNHSPQYVCDLQVTQQVVEVLERQAGELQFTFQMVEVAGVTAPDLQLVNLYVEYLRPFSTEDTDGASILTPTSEAIYELIEAYHGVDTLTLAQAARVERVVPLQVFQSLVLIQEVGYIGPRSAEAQTSIELDQVGRVPKVYERSVDTPIQLVTSITLGGSRRVSVESVLTVDAYADTSTKYRHVSHFLGITQTTVVEKVLTVGHSLELSQHARSGTLDVLADSPLNMGQGARYNPLPQVVEQPIPLGQYARSNLRHVAASSYLVLWHENAVLKPIRAAGVSELAVTEITVIDGQVVEVETGLRHGAEVHQNRDPVTSQGLSFSHCATTAVVRHDGLARITSNRLSLTHLARLSLVADATSLLILSGNAGGDAGRPTYQTLDITQLAEALVERGSAAGNTLDIHQSATYSLTRGDTLCTYSPFVGSSTDPNAPIFPTTPSEPLPGISVPFQLVYPSVGAVTDMVALKTPNFGNLDRLAFNRVLRETRGGHLTVFADPIWPQTQTLVVSFSGLKKVETDNLLRFLAAYLGKEVGMIDWEHRYWRGVITTPDDPVVEDSFDSYSASFEFQGEMDPTWNPSVVPPSLRYSPFRTPQAGGYYIPAEPLLPVYTTGDHYEAEADAPIEIASPLYLTGEGHVGLAGANATATARVVGLSLNEAIPGNLCEYLTEGRMERADWTEIAGTEFLTPGAPYFLGADTPGQITQNAPTAVGHYVVYLGRATTPTSLDIEIEPPILL